MLLQFCWQLFGACTTCYTAQCQSCGEAHAVSRTPVTAHAGPHSVLDADNSCSAVYIPHNTYHSKPLHTQMFVAVLQSVYTSIKARHAVLQSTRNAATDLWSQSQSILLLSKGQGLASIRTLALDPQRAHVHALH